MVVIYIEHVIYYNLSNILLPIFVHQAKTMYVLIISLAVGKTHSDILVRPARRKRLIVCSEMEAIGKKIKKKKTG